MTGRTALLAALALTCSWEAHAEDVSLAPSAAVSCLTPAVAQRPKIAYPPENFQRKQGGTIELELEFTARDRPPSVKVLEDDTLGPDMLAAVREHVALFRVPCMGASDPPVRLRQDYVFIPNDGRKVMSSEPRDQADIARNALWSCRKHINNASRPDYPSLMRRDNIEGNVYVVLRFTQPEAPPEMTVMASSDYRLEQSARNFIQGLRLPCVSAEPVAWRVNFQYRIEGRLPVLADLKLADLVRSSKPPLPTAYFDFTTMACPFDVRLTYFRPHARNEVGELDNMNPARQPFLDWLANLTLNIGSRDNTAVLGESMTVTVPCGHLDL